MEKIQLSMVRTFGHIEKRIRFVISTFCMIGLMLFSTFFFFDIKVIYRANDAYNALSPKEQEEVRDQANNIQASGARSAGNAAVSEAEKALSVSLTPELRRQIYLQGASGARLIQLPTLGIQPPNQFMTLSSQPTQQVQSQTYGPTQQYYTAAPLSVRDPAEYRRQQIARALEYPEKSFKNVISTAGGYIEKYAKSTEGKVYRTPEGELSSTPFGIVPYTPYNSATYRTPAQIRVEAERTLDVGSFFVPVVGQARLFTYGLDVTGRVIKGEPEAVKQAAVLATGTLFFRAGTGVARAEIPRYKTIYSSIVKPTDEGFEVVTLAETQRKTLRKTNKFETVITEKGMADEVKYFSSGLGITRTKGETKFTTFKTTSTGIVRDANFISIGEGIGVKVPGTKITKGLSATLEKDIINIERTSGVSIPVIPERLEMGFTEGSMSGSAKGITFILPKRAIEDGGVRFIRPQTIQKTSWASTFPKAQVERAVEKMSAVPKPSGNVLKSTAAASTLLRSGQASAPKTSSSPTLYPLGTPSQSFDIEFLSFGRPNIASDRLTSSPKTISIPRNAFSLSSALRENQLQVGSPRTLSIVSTTQPPRSRIRLRQPSAQQSAQQSKLLQMSRLLQNFRTQPPRTNPVVPRRTRFRIPPFPEEGGFSGSKITLEALRNIGVEVRRKGRFLPLAGTESTIGKALMKGAGTVDVTLARSFRLRDLSTGELLDVSQLPVGFRRSKGSARTFVEESKFALSTGGEKREINYFKRTKSNRRFL